MIYELFTTSGVAFWLVAIVASFVLCYMSQDDDPNVHGAGLVLAVFTGVVLLFSSVGATVPNAPWVLLFVFIVYALIGIVYSLFVAWPLLLYKTRRRIKMLQTEMHALPEGELSDRELAWSQLLEREGMYLYGVYPDGLLKATPPSYGSNEGRIITWAMLWPWDIAGSVLQRPFIWILEQILGLVWLRNVAQYISNRIFRDLQ